MGKILIIIGVILVIAGLIIHFNGRIPFLGKLPGDISLQRGNFRLYFPLTTSILLSILLSLLFYFFNRYKN